MKISNNKKIMNQIIKINSQRMIKINLKIRYNIQRKNQIEKIVYQMLKIKTYKKDRINIEKQKKTQKMK